ncbi:MAG TPA: hypothetical protein VJL89_10955 [Thermodesulfovibrionia bacterium]|nr:hypothetical protein [Thermodesulfovibrionia bacterium]
MSTQKSGDGCWLIPNTVCKGKVQTDVKNKKAQVCFACDYYASMSVDQKLAMEDKYGVRVK